MRPEVFSRFNFLSAINEVTTLEKILIVEDQENILMGLEDDLSLEGYEIRTAKDGLDALGLASSEHFNLILLDIMLPRMNGFSILKQLRKDGINTPVIILTARGEEVDRVLGLELGADDYVTKPFSPRELLARVKAILRRVRTTQQGVETYRFGDVDVDFKNYEVRKNHRPVYLTSLEFTLFRYFADHPKEVLSRDLLLDEIWGKDVCVDSRTVDTHVAHLRRKLENDSANPRHIIGIRNVGYKFIP